MANRWPRCFSVTEHSGYAPSSRLASGPPFLSALLPIYEMGWVLVTIDQLCHQKNVSPHSAVAGLVVLFRHLGEDNMQWKIGVNSRIELLL